MTSPHTDLDLTDAVEAAAAAQWTQRVPSIPWEKVVATNPVLAHGLREQALHIVTAAAPIIAAALTRAHAKSGERALPSVEDVARALWELDEQEADTTGGALDVPWSALDSLTQGLYRADAEDLLALLPGRAEAEVKAEALREAAEPQVIPRYAMLDVWQALGHEPVEFEAWRDRHGYSEAWARLCAEVRERRACDHERAARDIARTTAATHEQVLALVEALARGAKTLEEAWDEGYAAGLRDASRGEPGGTPNPYRAAVRPSEKEQVDD